MNEIKKWSGEFPVLASGSREEVEAAIAVVKDNLGGSTLSAFDLGRIKVPSGGSKRWTILTPDGEKSVESFSSIIIHQEPRRQYWPDGGSMGGPPHCSSADGNVGRGVRWDGDDPAQAHDCESCRLNEWLEDGSGKPCNEVIFAFLLSPGSLVPIPDLLQIPVTSVKGVRKYLLSLSKIGRAYYQVVTKWTLEPKQSRGNIAYCVATPHFEAALSAEEMMAVAEVRKAILPTLSKRATAANGSRPSREPGDDDDEEATASPLAGQEFPG